MRQRVLFLAAILFFGVTLPFHKNHNIFTSIVKSHIELFSMRYLLKMGILCLSALILTSCVKKENKHWIHSYVHVDYIKGKVSYYRGKDDALYYHISLYYGLNTDSRGVYTSVKEYEYYVNLHQDFANDYIYSHFFFFNGLPGISAPANDLQSMTITLTQHWDESHLKSDSLDDIAWLVGFNSTDFIRKGPDVINSHSGWSVFAEKVYGERNWEPHQSMRLIDCPLSECRLEDFFMLGEYDHGWGVFSDPFCHIFIKQPATQFDSLPFDIHATDIEGNELIVKF